MSAKLRIRVQNVHGDPLPDRGDIEIYRHSTGDQVARRRDRMLSSTLTLVAEPSELYRVHVYPTRYREVGRFVRAPAGGSKRIEIVCPIRPERVSAVAFTAYKQLASELQTVLSQKLLEGSDTASDPHPGRKLYDSLDDVQRAGLLNLHSKMAATFLPNERTTWSYLKSLYRVRGDRIFAHVALDFRDAVKNAVVAGQFERVDGALHTPPPGFELAGSFKTFDPFGNLQLTFFASQDAPLRFKLDADIDDARGIAHFFDVIHHFVTDAGTHPYDIHEILVATQQLDPGYVLTA